ncbi:MAG: glycogen debranching protein GlgX, partial [Cellulomonadaceae bacterium]
TRYSHKHNSANGEDNRDGTDDNRSWNHGLEGPGGGDDMGQQTSSLRRRSHRNLLGMLLLSAGTPMITAGDELGRTQHGNNNAYCQDNEISWVDWDLDPTQRNLLDTTRFLLAQRKALGALRAGRFYSGRPFPETPDGDADLTWHTVGGEPFTDGRWHDPHERALQMLRRCPDPEEPAVLLVINGSLDALEVTLADQDRESWVLLWDSTWEHPDARFTSTEDDEPGVTIEPLSLRLYASSASA